MSTKNDRVYPLTARFRVPYRHEHSEVAAKRGTSIKEFNEQFPTEDSSGAYHLKSRYGRAMTCPKCGKTGFYRVKGRKLGSAPGAPTRFILANTIFHKSDTPLPSWFFAIPS